MKKFSLKLLILLVGAYFPFSLNASQKNLLIANIQGDRISRLENLFGTKANLKFQFFTENICVKTENEGIIYCVTKGAAKYNRDALLVIDMNQRLMFVVGAGERESEGCSREELTIRGFYGNGKKASGNQISINVFSSTFDSYVESYSYVLGCSENFQKKWFFDGKPTEGYSYSNMKQPMPWEGNIVETTYPDRMDSGWR